MRREVGAPRRATLLLTGLTLLLAAGTAPVAQAAWSRPFSFAKATRADAAPPQLAFSPSGASAAAFGFSNADSPGSEQAWLAPRSAGGRLASARRVPGAAQVLSMAFRGSTLQLLVGSDPPTLACCSAAETIAVGADGRPGRANPLVPGLAGAATGRLLTLGGGRMLAAVATERGVWAAQSSSAGRFGSARLISLSAQEPTAMDAAWLGGESSTVVWTAGTGVAGSVAPRTIDASSGSRSGGPRRARAAFTVPAGHRIDELAVARRRGGERTLAWVESWYDGHGGHHSRVETADLTAHPRARPLSPADRLASGLSLAADGAGDQAVAWTSCSTTPSCSVQAAGRPAKGRFGSARTLGAADATASPSLAIAPAGQVVVGWVRGGRPVASAGFGAPVALSAATDATSIDVAYGPRHAALAAWSQGTLAPSIMGAAFRP